MNILFYRYGSICEPNIISVFSNLGLSVIEEKTEITNKNLTPSQIGQAVHRAIDIHKPIFVFSINFYPIIAEICYIHKILYLCWTVDCPVLELFTESIKRPTNRIFMFDQLQYEHFAPYNPTCMYHLPLAASIDRFDSVISKLTPKDVTKYSAEISFVGSLYSEKNPIKKLKNLPAYLSGYIDGIIESSLQIYGCNFMENALSDSFVSSFKDSVPDFFPYANPIENTDKYVIAHKYLGFQATEIERIRTLNLLAEHFPVDLYTASDTSPLLRVHLHGTAESLYEMPKIFYLSKINLNMTMKPIQSGLPLRIFDIMGCGGFLMTNYQSELTDYFEIGTDLEAYSCMEELVEKCAYYLKHEDIRKQIALQGYQKVKQYHTYPLRIAEMFQKVLKDSL